MASRHLRVPALFIVGTLLAGAAGAVEHVVNVGDEFFDDDDITIQVGDTVRFEKPQTSVPHNVRSDGFPNSGSCTFGPTCFRCGVGGCQGQGGSGDPTTAAFSITLDFFEEPGTFRYFCEVHGSAGGVGMAGRIVVQGAPPPPPPPPSDGPGQIRFTNGSYNRGEGIGSAVIQVERVGGDDGAVGVSFATSNGTAIAGQDYTQAMGQLAWADNEDGVKAFNVAILDDAAEEPNETVALSLQNPTGGATLGDPANATLTITDNDVPAGGGAGQLAFTSANVSVGEAMPFATVSVARAGGTTGAVSVDYETESSSAAAGSDYTAVGGTLEWAAGDGADKSLQVPILDDTQLEGDEAFVVSLAQPTGGATLGALASTLVTINDNEATPPCVEGAFATCLLGRFLVSIQFATLGGDSGDARVTKLTDSAASFEFFEPGNVEIVVKMKDACTLPAGNPLRNFWVFIAGLTNVRVEITIVDTETGTLRRFNNQLGGAFFTPAEDSPDGQQNPPGAIQATTEGLGAFPTCD